MFFFLSLAATRFLKYVLVPFEKLFYDIINWEIELKSRPSLLLLNFKKNEQLLIHVRRVANFWFTKPSLDIALSASVWYINAIYFNVFKILLKRENKEIYEFTLSINVVHQYRIFRCFSFEYRFFVGKFVGSY